MFGFNSRKRIRKLEQAVSDLSIQVEHYRNQKEAESLIEIANNLEPQKDPTHEYYFCDNRIRKIDYNNYRSIFWTITEFKHVIANIKANKFDKCNKKGKCK